MSTWPISWIGFSVLFSVIVTVPLPVVIVASALTASPLLLAPAAVSSSHMPACAPLALGASAAASSIRRKMRFGVKRNMFVGPFISGHRTLIAIR